MPRKAKAKKEIVNEQLIEVSTQAPPGMNNEAVLASNLEPSIDNTKETPNNDHFFESQGELVVDVFETNSDFVVLAAIAGVQIKDLDISVEKDMMIIKGVRPDPHGHPDNKYFYQECYWGPFSRKIVLPENIHTEKASAQMDKGMLTIKIPKMVSGDKKEAVELS
jgi:HSP20 family protein